MASPKNVMKKNISMGVKSDRQGFKNTLSMRLQQDDKSVVHSIKKTKNL